MNILLVRAKPTFSDMIPGIPIGLVHVAPMAESRGHHVELLDLALEPDPEPVLSRKLKERSWALAGFSCMTAEFEGSEKTARRIKEFDPAIRIVFGGQHPSIVAGELIGQSYCDFVVIGEGEETFAHFLEVWERNGDFSEVSGLAYKQPNGAPCVNALRPLIDDVNALPLPAYHLLDMDRYAEADYNRYPPKYRRAVQIFTSRGCPWHCTYCHDLFGKKFRPRSPENVVGEIRHLYDRYRIQEFMIEDDIFNFDMERAKRICDLLAEERLQIGLQFGNGIRLERLDQELIQKLAAAGTHHVAIAIESASPRIQRLTRKNLKLHMVDEVVRWMKQSGIHCLGFFMIGFPTETVEEMKMTIRFACRTDLDEALFNIVVPYAGTQLREQVTRFGLHDAGADVDDLREVIRIKTPDFDHAALRRLQRRAYLMFFLSRFRFLKVLPKLFNLHTGKRYLRALHRNFTPGFLLGPTTRNN
jgi:anaerobic magnesium-protoporphyrin IX monomethyl ester cyclase